MKSLFEWLRHWMLDPGVSGWADIATIMGGAGTAVAAAIALAALVQAKKLNKEGAQPYVAPFLENNAHLPDMLDVGVKNYGTTAARNVRIMFAPKPKISPWGTVKKVEDLNFPEHLGTLVPGQEWRTIWDDGAARSKSELPNHHDVVITYEGLDGELLEECFVLDWGPLYTRTFLETRTLHHVGRDIHEIQKTLNVGRRLLQESLRKSPK